MAALLAALAVLVAVPGCFLIEGPTPDAPARETLAPPPDPEFFPEGSAEDNWPYFGSVLTKFSDGEAEVNGENIVNALVDAGFEVGAMQVSFDTTETALVSDNIFVSVLIGDQCLVGQVVTADREVIAEVMPAVGPQTDICLIGETRVIDWHTAS